VILAMLLQSNGAALIERRITDIFKPLGTPAEAERSIGLFVMAITAIIFLVVAGILVYIILRFRHRPSDDPRQEPPQIFGSNQIEIAWTFIPLLIVFILIGVTARVIASIQDAPPPPSAIRLRVVGHQWWWELNYTDLGVTTANEIHLPIAGTTAPPAFLRLESVDVIHSFWVPQLSGKTDLIPNRANTMWIDPREPGIYLGNCAEYCGTQHANMLLRVIAEPNKDFLAWVEAQRKPANGDPRVAEGKLTFESLSCVNCHTVRGTTANGVFGPDLTHLMSRQTLAAGVVLNTPENLRRWVDDPQALKPGCFMPSMKLTNQQLTQVVSYLESLK